MHYPVARDKCALPAVGSAAGTVTDVTDKKFQDKTDTPGDPASGPAGRADSQRLLQQMRAAVQDHRAGRLDQAIAAYQAVLRDHPNFAEANHNLAVALRTRGRLSEAVDCWRRALAARADYAAPHAGLASALAAAGQDKESLKHALSAVRYDPGNLGYKLLLADQLRPMRFSSASPEVAKAILLCFETENIEYQLISAAALSLLRQDPAIGRALSLAEAGTESLEQALGRGELTALFENRLLHAVLSKSLVAAPDFERLLSRFRHCALRGLPDPGSDEEPSVLFHDDPSLLCALARQCFLNGYLYPESEAERAAVEPLHARLGFGPASVAELCVLAMYRPLHSTRSPAALANWARTALEPVQALVRQQLDEPLAEVALARGLPSATPVTDAISLAVRQQYETNPYPRWVSTNAKSARPLATVLGRLFPKASGLPEPQGPPRILVAGCGTGKHAIDVALRFQDAEVLAVDLSRQSLAYAKRRAGELGLEQIRFAQADILSLGALGERFDLIESVGVLHHLSEPLEGWRQLRRLLADRGVMKIGLYSAKARRSIDAGRRLLADQGFGPGDEDIRASRQVILDLPPDHPASAVAGELDFYSLSGCRDLLFHAQECAVSIPEIGSWLRALDLRFLGFELVDRKIAEAYKSRFPEDPAMTDLSLWEGFENERPESFRTMYQFWCQPNTADQEPSPPVAR